MLTAIVNGKIFTHKTNFCEALLIDDDRVVQCGTTKEVLAKSNCQTTIIDLQGKTAVPGFHDSHLHVQNLGNVLNAVRLNDAKSPADMIEAAKKFIAEKNPPAGTFIQGRGWNQDYFTTDKRLPTCQDLDQISAQHPIIFVRACGHMMVCNSVVLKMAGITASSPQVDGGEFYRFEDGEPNGLFSENACGLITSLIPPLSPERIADNLKAAVKHINSFGITAVQTNDIYGYCIDQMIEGYRILHKNGDGTVRVYHQCGLESPTQIHEFTQKYGTTGTETDFGTIGPLKMLIDGSLGARTALMRQPYHDDASTNGICCIPDAELHAMVNAANEVKMQAAIHAIGDLAIEKVLDAYQSVAAENNPLRHGVVHCQITDMPLINRFKEQNILAYVQPIFVHYDQHIVADRVGQELADSSYAFGSMMRLGIHTSYGTDSPVESPNTLENLYTAVTRKDLSGKGPYLPEEAVTIEDAVDLYTSGSAYSAFAENKLGKLLPGYLADMAVLSEDIFTIPSENIKNLQVDMTILGGRIVFQR